MLRPRSPGRCNGDEIETHPYADVLPLLEGEAFDSLAADFRANGLLEPITIHEGLILDGRNRLNACKAAGVKPHFLEFEGDDPRAFVLSLNLTAGTSPHRSVRWWARTSPPCGREPGRT